jgi:hypothetical protein
MQVSRILHVITLEGFKINISKLKQFINRNSKNLAFKCITESGKMGKVERRGISRRKGRKVWEKFEKDEKV